MHITILTGVCIQKFVINFTETAGKMIALLFTDIRFKESVYCGAHADSASAVFQYMYTYLK